MATDYFSIVKPYGNIHISSDGSHPALGVWEPIASGRVLTNVSPSNLVGTDYGYRDNLVPEHDHTLEDHKHDDIWSGGGIWLYTGGSAYPHSSHTDNQNYVIPLTVVQANLSSIDLNADGNIAPYKVVSFFKRIDSTVYDIVMTPEELYDVCFPVSTVLLGQNETLFDVSAINPAVQFETFGEKRMLVGFDDSDELFDLYAKEGGFTDQSAGAHEHASWHGHSVKFAGGSPDTSGWYGQRRFNGPVIETIEATGRSSFAGAPAEHNSNYQPYIALYVKERTV